MINKIIVTFLVYIMLMSPVAYGALEFTAASGDNVNFGSDDSLDDIAKGTLCVWYNINTLDNAGFLVAKGDAIAGFWVLAIFGALSGRPSFQLHLSTAKLEVSVDVPDLPGQTAGEWNFIAVTFEESVDASCKMYGGNLTLAAEETAAPDYETKTGGSGTFQTNATTDLIVGNNFDDEFDSGIDGSIAWIGIWDGVLLTDGEIIDQQFNPHKTAGCVLMSELGFNGALGTNTDLSGNGNNSAAGIGTVLDAHVPKKAPFGG